MLYNCDYKPLKVGFETARRSNVTEYKWEKQIGEKHNWYVLPILAALGSQIQVSLVLFSPLLGVERFAAVKGEKEAVCRYEKKGMTEALQTWSTPYLLGNKMSRRMHAKFEIGVRLLPIYKNCSRLYGLLRLGDYFGWKELDKHYCYFLKYSNCVGFKTQKENRNCV